MAVSWLVEVTLSTKGLKPYCFCMKIWKLFKKGPLWMLPKFARLQTTEPGYMYTEYIFFSSAFCKPPIRANCS